MDARKRTGPGSKTRSGCVTCKARRVKCDETKPSCLRCQNLRLECGGYKEKKKLTHSTKRLLPLVPKIDYVSKTVAPLTLPPPHRLFANDQEFQYFKIFADTTSASLAEYLDITLWSQIVLQASQQETFIKHAIIALGALNKSRDITGQALVAGNAHYQIAFQHYGNSIQGIRKACQEERKSRRTILIACLLAICFEYYHGNIDLAVAHVQNGIRLIDEWFLSIMHLTSVDGQQFLQGIIEDELISVFTRLELDVHGFYVAKLIEMHPKLQKVAAGIIQAIPGAGFANLSAARKYFDILLTQVDRFGHSLNDQLWALSDVLVKSTLTIDVDNLTGVIVPSPAQQQHVKFLKGGLVSWRRAFQPVLTQSLKMGGKEVLVAKSLALRFLCSTVALHCCFGPELSYDSYVPEFRAALLLARTLCDAANSRARHTFIVTSILIRSLFFIASKCRDVSLRTEARDYLQSMSRREGIWDSKVACTITTTIMELEKSDGPVPEQTRLRAIKTTFDLHKRQGKLSFLRATMRVGDAGFVAHRVELCW